MNRESFEKYATAQGLFLSRAPQAMMFANGRRVPADGYIMLDTAAAWDAWQSLSASAEAVIADLKSQLEAAERGRQEVAP